MFLVNSRSHLFIATPFCSTSKSRHIPGAHLLPKLRCHFAEFLHPSSLKDLRLLASPTCVRFSTVNYDLELRDFSWKPGINCSTHKSIAIVSQPYRVPDLPKTPAYLLRLGKPTPIQSSLLRHPIAVIFSTGILTCFPSITHFCLTLGAD